ncbi:hypothetical protein AB0F43_09210 [Kribbella sp. NPDC023972]
MDLIEWLAQDRGGTQAEVHRKRRQLINAIRMEFGGEAIWRDLT